MPARSAPNGLVGAGSLSITSPAYSATRPSSGSRKQTPIDSLLHALVDDERLRTGRALEFRRPLLPLGVEADLQRVPADLVDAQHDRPLVGALGHRHIKGLR